MNKEHKPALLVRALSMNIVKVILLEIGVGVRPAVISCSRIVLVLRPGCHHY